MYPWIQQSMNWSLPDYTASPDAEEIYNQISWRNGLVVAMVGNSGRVVRNGMVDGIVGDPHENDVDCNRSSVGCKESDVAGSRRDVNGKESVVEGSSLVRSDVTHSIFQLGNLARKKFVHLFQPVRKLDFTHAHSSRSQILIRVKRLRYLMLTRFSSSTHFIWSMVDWQILKSHSFSPFEQSSGPPWTAPTSALPSPVAIRICCAERSKNFSLINTLLKRRCTFWQRAWTAV